MLDEFGGLTPHAIGPPRRSTLEAAAVRVRRVPDGRAREGGAARPVDVPGRRAREGGRCAPARTKSSRRPGACWPAPRSCSACAARLRGAVRQRRRGAGAARHGLEARRRARGGRSGLPALRSRRATGSSRSSRISRRRCARYGEHIDASPARLQEVEDRLALLERLKRKYGPDAGRRHRKAECARAAARGAAERRRAARGARSRDAAPPGASFSTQPGRSRVSGATRRRDFAAQRQDVCSPSWRWSGPQFEVRFATDAAEAAWTEAGIDVAEFYLSPNLGEDLRPLARIASGGELSRVMLAIQDAGRRGCARQDADLRRGRRRHRRARGRRRRGEAARGSASVPGAVHHAPAADRRRRPRALPDREGGRGRPDADARRAARAQASASTSWPG